MPHILIVDDEKEFTQVLHNTLTLRKYSATEANSGKEALDILAATKIDLMTLDLNMPGMSGLEVAEVVQKKYPDVQIIIITGFGSDYDEDIKRYGIKHILPKPVSIVDLLNKIKELTAQV